MAIGHFFLDGYTTLLAYIFVIFIEYLIFTLIFKREEGPNGDSVRLRFGENTHYFKGKARWINLFIVLILIPFTIIPLKGIIHHFLEKTGFYLIPITFLASGMGYIAATKEHFEHKWEKEDAIILAVSLCLFLITIALIFRLGLAH